MTIYKIIYRALKVLLADAENMQVKYDTTVAQYFYDGEGHRVKSVTDNQTLTTLFVYDAMGKTINECLCNSDDASALKRLEQGSPT